MTLTKKFATAIATGALLMQAAAPLTFAETTITVTGNGADSYNKADVSQTSTTAVVQSNVANVSNNVSGSASTGGNDANMNTGGDVNVSTGDAKNDVEVSNNLNSNSANVDLCDCEGDVKVNISGNGYDSTNKVYLDSTNTTAVVQANEANVENNVEAKASTGKNDANKNTGGDVSVMTGNAKSNVAVSTTANANMATLGGGHGEGGDIEAIIEGNGADSYNKIDMDLARELLLDQGNLANVANNVYAGAYTGWNDANKNTGGEVEILTGDAENNVEVDNNVNFNAAEVGCDCLLDLKAKVAGNGYDSKNKIYADLTDDRIFAQANEANLDNEVESKAKTGDNDANKNTGEADSDPSIMTGDAESNESVSNSGNMNVLGDAHMPEVDVEFDFSEVWMMFWSHMHLSN